MKTTRRTLNLPPDRHELRAMLGKAAAREMTSTEREAQRGSWVIGELMLADPNLTREEAIARYERAKKDNLL